MRQFPSQDTLPEANVPYSHVVAKPAGKAPRVPKKPFPWLLLMILLASVYVLWVLPHQLGPRHIAVDFEPAPAPKHP